MSTGASSDQYQTVTIVPSDGDTGEVVREISQLIYSDEIITTASFTRKIDSIMIQYLQVSYVLIVQQPEDEKAGNSKSGAQDGGGADDVYDFDGDPDDPNALDEFITDDKKIKGAGKRSQTVTITFSTLLYV